MRRIIASLMAIGLAAIWLGCGGVPPTYYYRLSYEPESHPNNQNNNTSVPVTLGITQCTTDILYESDKIVYRNSPYEVQFYHYRRWIAPPKKLVTEEILTRFRDSESFQEVVSLPSSIEVDYIVKAHIHAFEEWDESNTWYGKVSIEFRLLNPETEQLVWNRRYTEQTPAQKKEPVEVVRAIDLSLQRILSQAIEGIKSHLKAYKI